MRGRPICLLVSLAVIAGEVHAQDPQPNLPPEVRAAYEAKLAEARRAWEHTPDNADSIIWLGRRTAYLGGYREAIADSGEAPIAVGVTNNSPYLQELIDAGPARFGVNFISERSTFQSGETGGWAGLNVAKVSVMQAPPLYHTTGEVLDVISTPGLERMARFLASFVAAVDRAPRERINP